MIPVLITVLFLVALVFAVLISGDKCSEKNRERAKLEENEVVIVKKRKCYCQDLYRSVK